MRVNFLFSPTYIAFDMGGVDFSAYDQLHVWFRGIPYPANDVIEMRVEMVGSSSSWWGQVEPDVSTCPYVEGETYCDWGEHIVDFAAWDGKSDVQEVRLHVLSQMGNAEFYIDSIQLTGVPLDSDHETWGSVKALYH
jgi:hypothetical protein